MNKQLIDQLRVKHKSAAACLEMFENTNDASFKNMLLKMYESFVIDIVEMQPAEMPEYFNLDWDKHNDEIDQVMSTGDKNDKIRITMHEEMGFPKHRSASPNLSY